MDGFLQDAQGRMVPTDKVRPQDALENDLVNDLLNQAKHFNNRLGDFKGKAFADVMTFMDLIAEKYGVTRGGRKGNLTLTSYDGLRKVQIQNADYIQFGPELQIAKDLVDECITQWSDGVNGNLKLIIDRAFQVDKEGKLNVGEILKLRRLNITDEKWKRAMDAIGDSIRVTMTRAYIRFYERPNVDGHWKSISLDIANI